jgi:hypothetical protein
LWYGLGVRRVGVHRGHFRKPMAKRKKPAIGPREAFLAALMVALANEIAKVVAKILGAMLEAIPDIIRNLF